MKRAALLLLCLLAVAGCEREQRRFDTPPSAASAAGPSQRSALRAGPSASAASAVEVAAASAPASAAVARTAFVVPASKNPHEDNAYAVAQGKRFYRWYNCAGCHANGGGGMGPALMDERWLYGHEPEQIAASILQGRPNGMPSFAGRIPEDQVWQITAYIRSMSGQLRTDVAPSRSDSLSAGPPEARRDKATPRPQGATP
ncbi:MAG TPA: cytochrome c [Albitalea sp.]|jgi:cytochrome c oxidase cbb3-type subunit 3|nr:cytochrome c [Albitalea sp.]